MAERLGVSQASFSRWERAHQAPRGPALLRLAALIGTPVEVLTGGRAADTGVQSIRICHRIGEGEPSQATLVLPDELLIHATSVDLCAVEIADASADLRFPRGSTLICEPWGSLPVAARDIALVAPAAAPSEDVLRVAQSSGCEGGQQATRWYGLSGDPALAGPLPPDRRGAWEPRLRIVAALTPFNK